MAAKVAIVSAGDDKFFSLLDGLFASLEDAKLGSAFDFCVYDVGLTPEQAANLKSRHVTVVAPQWTIDFPDQAHAPRWFRAMTNRPCLPRHFPGYETYVWIDADAWIQQPEGIYAAVDGARRGPIAIVAERFGRSMVFQQPSPTGEIQLARVSEQSIRRSLAVCYRECFGQENECRANETFFNTGFFALRGDSPIWDVWMHYLRRGLNLAVHFLVEQQALTLGILEGKIAMTQLPNRFNWNISLMAPMYDAQACRLIDPTDRKPLGLVHLTEIKHLDFINVPDMDGRMIQIRLHYRDFRDQMIRLEAQ